MDNTQPVNAETANNRSFERRPLDRPTTHFPCPYSGCDTSLIVLEGLAKALAHLDSHFPNSRQKESL